jgi:hypothetical protein
LLAGLTASINSHSTDNPDPVTLRVVGATTLKA